MTAERHRNPVDVVVVAGGRRAVTANQGADTVSLIDLENGRVLAESACGLKPSGIACTVDGRRVAVSNLWSGNVALFEIDDTKLRSLGSAAVGHLPRGLVFAPDGGSFYVALSGLHEVVHVDWATRRVLRRWPAASEPRRLAVTSDGQRLLAISGRSAQVRCWDTSSGKLVWERAIREAFNLHGLALSPDNQQVVVAHIHDRHHAIAKDNIEQGWALDNRLSRLKVTPDPGVDYWQIALDVRGLAVGDPCAAAFHSKGDRLAIAAAGTHEILLLRTAAVPWGSGDPGDFLDASLDVDQRKLRRIPVGGRPLAVQFAGDQVVVANALLDCVQIVDANSGQIVRQISLGGPRELSLARRGEAIFYDAQRSHHQWFSCHTCHPDGHTSGRNFDTLNDDSYGNPKLTPSLHGVAKTGPWTWHGRHDDLGKAVVKSLTETHFGKAPSAGDVQAVLAYLGTLDHPPNPNAGPGRSLSAAAERGRALFFGQAGCQRCHKGEQYTSDKTYDISLDGDNSPFDRWNPPTLRGLINRGPYLHDGRADTLDEVLRGDHAPEKVGGSALTPEQRRDLIEFLKTL
jgi:DNA-binding beta-propeller fold protein YncE